MTIVSAIAMERLAHFSAHLTPLEKLLDVIEENKKLYERLLEVEREKNALMESLLKK